MRRRTQGNTQIRANAVIKGTIEYGKSVDINFGDFADLKMMGQVRPLALQVQFTTMNAPTYVAIVQWSGETANRYFKIENFLIPKTRKIIRTYRWPQELALLNDVGSTQIIFQLYHSAGGDVYGDEKPLLFYLAKLTVARTNDMMDTTVDPPHVNIKHSTSSFDMLEDM